MRQLVLHSGECSERLLTFIGQGTLITAAVKTALVTCLSTPVSRERNMNVGGYSGNSWRENSSAQVLEGVETRGARHEI
jgi:hypothetical protein